jgi:hypothetical protein
LNDMGTGFFKVGAKDFEAWKWVRFVFHGIHCEKFGVIIDKGDEITISLTGCDFVWGNIGVN